jgi:hypothetical protein
MWDLMHWKHNFSVLLWALLGYEWTIELASCVVHPYKEVEKIIKEHYKREDRGKLPFIMKA